MFFEARLRVVVKGGTTSAAATGVDVHGASEALLVITSGREPAGKDFPALRDAHVADYKRMFDRVSLDLGTHSAAPTDERIGLKIERGQSGVGVPPWASAYTTNINTEMNYWPAEVANLSECHEPLLRMVRELSVTGREVARKMYKRRGWVEHHNMTIWRDASVAALPVHVGPGVSR
jgi:alpha-L-fucosidase 2